MQVLCNCITCVRLAKGACTYFNLLCSNRERCAIMTPRLTLGQEQSETKCNYLGTRCVYTKVINKL